ncbi:sporulation protein YqfD [Gracilibacillus salinarum]|uniref:Sporulation protein YqfD n=1 Tax=Gracilibacillus salinarum TaxID=2932255 RepID=A0ABY4GPA0_9BACI|nr:sporulation protein YqfD [Gracilibacillus salinarum]UOQ86044.1 sporulation protein YqfD [Gracilibacillus salinarum]
MFFHRKNWLAGYITIEIKGQYPEHFFDMCARYDIPSWDIQKTDTTTATGKIKLSDLPKLRAVRRKSIYKIHFKDRMGLPFFLRQLVYQKPFLVSIAIALSVIFLLSNVVWRIDVVGLDEELERKVKIQMEEYGLERGSLQWNVDSPGTLQQRLLADVPELLWIGVKKKGSAYHLEGVEKTTVEKKEEEAVGHLVASKEGVIVDLYVKKGQPLVQPNDVVYQGDTLVSAFLNESDDENEDEKPKKSNPVAAEGEVIAEVWYKSEVTVPLNNEYAVINGMSEKKHYVHLSNYLIPIWNFKKPEFKDYQMDVEEKEFYFLKWKLPITYVEQTIYQKEMKKEQLTEKKAKEIALEQAKRELRSQISQEAEIKEEKILHETVENGKVKLTLYFTVLEDIAKKQPLSQGD